MERSLAEPENNQNKTNFLKVKAIAKQKVKNEAK